MNSLIAKQRWVLVALLFSVQSCAEEQQVNIAECFEKSAGIQVAKVDERNHRIFAVPKQQSREELVSQIESSEKCFSNSDWSVDWSISLFRNAKYAGYKDEKHIVPYHKNDEWAKAYLGEYDGASKAYTEFPALKH